MKGKRREGKGGCVGREGVTNTSVAALVKLLEEYHPPPPLPPLPTWENEREREKKRDSLPAVAAARTPRSNPSLLAPAPLWHSGPNTLKPQPPTVLLSPDSLLLLYSSTLTHGLHSSWRSLLPFRCGAFFCLWVLPRLAVSDHIALLAFVALFVLPPSPRYPS